MVESTSPPNDQESQDGPAQPVPPDAPEAPAEPAAPELRPSPDPRTVPAVQTPPSAQAARTIEAVRAIRKAREKAREAVAVLAAQKAEAARRNRIVAAAPVQPAAPVAPVVADAPAAPVMPDAAVVADAPAVPVPAEAPPAADAPAEPAAPEVPDVPQAPAEPVAPEVPDVPPAQAEQVTPSEQDAQQGDKTPRQPIAWPRWIAAVVIVLAAGISISMLRDANVSASVLLFRATGIDLTVLWDPQKTIRVKQTMTIETPAGEVTSSVVRERRVERSLFASYTVGSEFGEALVIPLPDGRYLFAVFDEFMPPVQSLLPPNGTRFSEWSSQDGKSAPQEVPQTRYPDMLTFDDPKDPLTVTQVDPLNLKAAFKQDYRIKSYTVAVTDEPVTQGRIAGLLPWIGPFPEPRICPPIGSSETHACRQFTHGHFRTVETPK